LGNFGIGKLGNWRREDFEDWAPAWAGGKLKEGHV